MPLSTWMRKTLNNMEKKTDTIALKSPYFSAGGRFGWDNKDLVGFGINRKYFVGQGTIIIKTKWGDYKIDKVYATALVKKYNAVYIAKGVTLGVIPRFACDEIK